MFCERYWGRIVSTKILSLSQSKMPFFLFVSSLRVTNVPKAPPASILHGFDKSSCKKFFARLILLYLSQCYKVIKNLLLVKA